MPDPDVTEPVSLSDLAASATRARRNATICIAGQLAADYEALERRLALLVQEGRYGDSLGDAASVERVQIAEQMEKLRDQMRAREATFTFEYIGAEPWSTLMATEGDDKDAEALAICVETLVQFNGKDVTAKDKEALAALWPTLNVGQRNELVTAAVEANTGRVSVPFSHLASATLHSTDEK